MKTLLTDYNVPPEVASAVENAANGVEAWLSSSATDIAGTIGIVFTIGLLATFLTFFFMMDGDKAWVWVLSSANEWRREAITTSGHVALERVGGYLRGTAVIAAFDGAVRGPVPPDPRGPARSPAGGHRLLRSVHPVRRRPGHDASVAAP